MAQDREWSFKRPERLDVKKPGPGFGVNNFAFRDAYSQDDDSGQLDEGAAEIPSLLGEGALLPSRLMSKNSVDLSRDGVGDPRGEVAEMLGDFALRENQEIPDVLLADEGVVEEATDEVVSAPKAEKLQEKKEQVDGASPATPTETPAKELEKPNSYVHISTAETLKTEKEGADLARYIVRLSGLTAAHLQNLKVGEDRIMFRIGENAKGITASDVAKKAEELRDQVKAKTGQTISQAGIGDEVSLELQNSHSSPTTMLALVYSSNKKHIVAAAAIVCGVMAALLVVASVLFFLRRNAKSKAKLLGLTAHDTEASKDYQDLCRARMAGKAGEGGKVEPPTTHVPTQRIASLSKDSDNGNNSPSSRSSTSSWSEEPVASNMDISTGHMVLNYMEDHLKNKDRLEQEWIALCAYEAEPCATTIAMKPENSKKNRYPDSVPYDHNRVMLNSHANVNGSDYINASSIQTDHDPRNPAYIATQGPLNTTAADFWQLVWEQGSVVIVMLTRLTENGLAFCHRYWPEEGSDLYHIYEVHLVSEHIWCDDYLVRSFYLKNVKTGETRTVTQFHFLSWPDSGTPASTKALLEFRRKVNKSYRGRSCPIIVHCSDGIGRTGTYCLIDMVLNRMAKGAKEIDIAATLEHIRDQRPHMVKSKAQFEFVLMAVAEEVHAILKALPQ
ncbi:receptor-type tyrosine-protein phosphatase N2-like isoform X4 [Macrobrachium nipponense]|uniref:receptor-type tyrosine-protein phosphatase N2-like isoform X4 n=1 Tax=Macrobrachium nipponense TaxID=159736 RepID=UPI0030C8B688